MPNHVTNIIRLQGDEQRIREMLERIQNDEYGIGTIDFNKIIPMPDSLNIEAGTRTDRGLKAYREFMKQCERVLELYEDIPTGYEQSFRSRQTDIDDETWELGKQAFQNIQEHGAPTWYDWCINNWGTKWNAYGYDTGAEYMDLDVLAFRTAWNAPRPILEKLSEMYPDITFEHEWADEDIGCNCGRRLYSNGEITEEYYPESEREAVEFAASVWGYDVEEYMREYFDQEQSLEEMQI